jgi:ATP-dependent Clp protease ATP-binding subunit ClpB
MRAKWQEERSIADKIQENKHLIEDLKFQAEEAERKGDYGLVAEIRYGKIIEAKNKIEQLIEEKNETQNETSLVREEVTAEDIAEIVAKWTGIPVTRMLQTERDKLLNLEDELHNRVVGQNEAIQAVADAVRRSRAGLQEQKKPVGSFLFLGTTGVGKTELAKALAEFLFNDENMMTRLDMSEYQERHSVSRLVGAPPGYVGYDEGGQLTEAVRRKPYSVVLLDEIEKAHPDVFNTLLQVLDDGRLTDNKGRTVNFKNTIIIMTSNAGSGIIQDNFARITESSRDKIVEKTKQDVLEALKETVRPEFLNRIDEIIMFAPLSKKDIRQIVSLQIAGIQKTLSLNNITLNVSEYAVEYIAEQGYDPVYGARPLKRVIQRELLNELSKQIIAGKLNAGETIHVDSFGDKLVFEN